MTSSLHSKLSVGSDINYFCSRCHLELGHRILAMVGSEPARVRCNTCKSERNYRATKRLSKVLDSEGPSVRRTRVVASSSGESIYQLYQKKLHEAAAKTPKAYRIDEAFEVGDAIDHVKFGRGIVLKLIHPDRMEVIFPDEMKVLMKKASLEE
ncbi:MAG: hypothetical protein J0L93_04900 [Deltaproteobacteria bacterium]|nr:hypothetical protein [Deltaproteobacteria bacterium]